MPTKTTKQVEVHKCDCGEEVSEICVVPYVYKDEDGTIVFNIDQKLYQCKKCKLIKIK